MKTTTEYTAEKLEALRVHLMENENFTQEEAAEAFFDERFDTFQCGSWEYKVLTDEEADAAAREEIMESLWAFNAAFILHHTEFYQHSTVDEDEAFVKALRDLQGRICEGANPIVEALIQNLDVFVEDAIDADGRGHFLSPYDGEENESADGKFYIYRIN